MDIANVLPMLPKVVVTFQIRSFESNGSQSESRLSSRPLISVELHVGPGGVYPMYEVKTPLRRGTESKYFAACYAFGIFPVDFIMQCVFACADWWSRSGS